MELEFKDDSPGSPDSTRDRDVNQEEAVKANANFPIELLPDVLDNLETDFFVSEEKWCADVIRGLRNCALVHRSWTATCQAYLRHNIKLQPCFRNRNYEMREWEQLGTDNAGSSTRSLALKCGCFTAECPYENCYKDLVSAAPNLRSLFIGEIAQRSPAHLRKTGLLSAVEGLSNLYFVQLNIRYDKHLPRLFRTLNMLPRLRTLSLRVYLSGEEEHDILERIPARTFPLTKLCLYQSNSIFPFGLLAWLLHPSPLLPDARVTELKLSASPGPRLITLMTSCTPEIVQFADDLRYVERMKMMGWTMKYEVLRSKITSRCVSLRSLYVDVDLAPAPTKGSG